MTRSRGLSFLALVFLVGAGLASWKWLSPGAPRQPLKPRPTIPSRRATVPDTTRTYPEILVDAGWLRSHIGEPGIIVVDARPEDRYRKRHIAGALHLDPRQWNGDPRALADLLGSAGVSATGTVVCVSGREDPAADGRLFCLLELAGHRDVRVLAGGVQAWQKAGGAMDTGPPAAAACLFRAAPDTSRLADFQYVQKVMGVPGCTILDPRPEEDWNAGHIPHSLPLVFDSLAAYGRHPGANLQMVFRNWGPRDNDYISLQDEIVIGGDVPSSALLHPYLAARLTGREKLHVYPEGFQGWEARGDLPIVRIPPTAELRRCLTQEHGGQLVDAPSPGLIFLDLREYGDFNRGHIPGAICLPSHEFADSFEVVVAARWPGATRESTPVIVYCYGVQCIRSRNCTTIAARHGWRVLEWYRAGVDGWRAAGEALAQPSNWAPKTFPRRRQ